MDNKRDLTVLTKPIILQAQQKLMPPGKFYSLCRKVRQFEGRNRIYFLAPAPLDLKKGINTHDLRIFFDYLARYVRLADQAGCQEEFSLEKVSIRVQGQTFKAVKVKKGREAGALKISVEIAGTGMIGRVARVRINEGEDWALKAFFDPDFVWQHGPWAEIPVGIYLKAHQVTKDIPEFKFAGQDWAVWEWIYPHTNPQSRKGITYEQFAQQKGLTKLNTLNRSNYNPHQMRLDPGGIQKEYLGRRFHDLLRGIVFYIRKAHREGFSSLTPYLTGENLRYVLLRLITLIFPRITKIVMQSQGESVKSPELRAIANLDKSQLNSSKESL
ncbi:MAG: hypothetical protein AB4426_09500 [Xenococcaceae cyanobacterium]